MKINEKHFSLPPTGLIAGFVCVLTLTVAAFLVAIGKDTIPEKIGTLDLPALLADQSQQLVKIYPNGQVPPGVMQQVVEEIKENIKDYGLSKKMTLLAKGAVLSDDLPDYTEEFRQVLNERNEGNKRVDSTRKITTTRVSALTQSQTQILRGSE